MFTLRDIQFSSFGFAHDSKRGGLFTGVVDGDGTKGKYISHYRSGMLHREDGPALEWYDGKSEWYLNGDRYSFDDWCKILKISDEDKTLLKLEYGN